MNNKLQNIAIIFLLCIVVILLALNLLKSEENGGGGGGVSAPVIDPKLKPEDDPYIINQVKNTIIKRADTIQDCYNKYLESKPDKVEGRIKMDWRISPEGDVVSPELVTAEFGDEAFYECMKSEIGKWSFPKPPSGLQKYVAHKFFFKKTE